MIQPTIVKDNKELSEASKTERDLTGFSSKELSPLSMRSGQKSSPMSLNPPVEEPTSSTEAKQE